MKSGKQRRTEIREKRLVKSAKEQVRQRDPRTIFPGEGTALCNTSLLARYNGYGTPPEFVARGYYVDMAFRCKDCTKEETWTATQQKWWYEIAKGSVETKAIRCRGCRRKERERIAEARRVHLEGLALKKNRRADT